MKVRDEDAYIPDKRVRRQPETNPLNARLARSRLPCQDPRMAPAILSQLLQLSAGERAELAMALWESLDDSQREAELTLTPDQAAELDRRLAEHLADPGSAIPWDEVRRRVTGKA